VTQPGNSVHRKTTPARLYWMVARLKHSWIVNVPAYFLKEIDTVVIIVFVGRIV
jgi:hypothetical protein